MSQEQHVPTSPYLTVQEVALYTRLSAQVLGHRSFQTTESYYQQADLNRAYDAYTTYVLQLRKKSRYASGADQKSPQVTGRGLTQDLRKRK